MGQYNTAVLTTAGQSLLTSILGAEGTLTFSKFQTSSYQYASGTDLSALTSLQNVEQEVLPSAGGVTDATTFYSSSTISNEGVAIEYDCNTVGLFATDGEDEVLFAVSTAVIPDVIPVDDGGAPSTYTYTMSIGVSSTANITVEVDDQGILRVSSIVDNLNSTSATAPLSANQGNVIAKDMVENILSGNTNTTGGILATGSYFINNTGQLCRVTTDIPVDGAITLNTNCVAVNVGGELTELNSKWTSRQDLYIKRTFPLEFGSFSQNVTYIDLLAIEGGLTHFLLLDTWYTGDAATHFSVSFCYVRYSDQSLMIQKIAGEDISNRLSLDLTNNRFVHTGAGNAEYISISGILYFNR